MRRYPEHLPIGNTASIYLHLYERKKESFYTFRNYGDEYGLDLATAIWEYKMRLILKI
jgi:hypothetical protein